MEFGVDRRAAVIPMSAHSLISLGRVEAALARLAMQQHQQALAAAHAQLTESLQPILAEHGLPFDTQYQLVNDPRTPGGIALLVPDSMLDRVLQDRADDEESDEEYQREEARERRVTRAVDRLTRRAQGAQREPSELARRLAEDEARRIEFLKANGGQLAPTAEQREAEGEEHRPSGPELMEALAAAGVQLGS